MATPSVPAPGRSAVETKLGPTRAAFEAMTDAELQSRYRSGLSLIDPRVFELSDEQMDMAFLPEAGVGNWPVRVLIGHLADADMLFIHRMRRAVAEDNPVVALWDEHASIESGMYNGGKYPVAGFIAVIHTLRRWSAEWLATLTPEQLARKMMHPEQGALSVRRVLEYAAWHLEHHGAYLNAKVCKMLGPAAEGGCCGDSCGCHK